MKQCFQQTSSKVLNKSVFSLGMFHEIDFETFRRAFPRILSQNSNFIFKRILYFQRICQVSFLANVLVDIFEFFKEKRHKKLIRELKMKKYQFLTVFCNVHGYLDT